MPKSHSKRTQKIYETKQSAIGGLQTYSYDDGDKLQSITKTSGTVNYTYDGCGRTSTISSSSGTKTFTWDYEDRLTNLSGGGVTSTNYGYNGVGSRTSKSNANGSRAYKRNGVGVTAPVLSDGVSTMVPGIAENTGGAFNFYQTDRLGSMKAYGGTDTAEYDAFGKVILRTGTAATQKGFAGDFGYQEDGESGYKLLGHRYYDADSGRFLSRDPARAGRNWYGYCSNNPLKYVDATGHSDLPACELELAEMAADAAGVDAAGANAVTYTLWEQFWGWYNTLFMLLPPWLQYLLGATLGISGPYASRSGGGPSPTLEGEGPFPPLDGGDAGSHVPIFVRAGTPISRIGGPGGRFCAPLGQARETLSVPSSKDNIPEEVWTLFRDIVFVQSKVTPWFGQPGGGTQLVLSEPYTIGGVAQPPGLGKEGL